VLSKLFMRQISQNPNENQTGISLWTLEHVLQRQAAEREAAEARMEVDEPTTEPPDLAPEEEDEEDEYAGAYGDFDESDLMNIDMPVPT